MKGQRMVYIHIISGNYKVASMKISRGLVQSCISVHNKYNAAQTDRNIEEIEISCQNKRKLLQEELAIVKKNRTRKLGIDTPG